jgi:hypothetical protein
LQFSLSCQLFLKAEQILRLLEKTQGMKRNDRGELSVNRNLLRDPKVAELVANAVRSQNNTRPVVWQAVVNATGDYEIPVDLLGKNLTKSRTRKPEEGRSHWEKFTILTKQRRKLKKFITKLIILRDLEALEPCVDSKIKQFQMRESEKS